MGRLSAVGKLSIAQPANANSASRMFGGIRIWAPDDAILDQGLEELRGAITEVLAENPTVDKRSLLYTAGAKLGEKIEKRVLGGVLGEELREGRADAVPCASLEHKTFRVYVSSASVAVFRARVEDIQRRLADSSSGSLLIREVRELHFGGKDKQGAWTCASHLVGRLVHIGMAVYVDRYRIAWPKEIARALI